MNLKDMFVKQPNQQKLGETNIGPQEPTTILTPPRGVDVGEFNKASRQKVLMNATITEGGSVLVDCPHCLIAWKVKTPVDVTRFVDADGKRAYTVECKRGHTLRFKPIDEWRASRQRLGLQSRS